ncbi:MAG: hypothetical protein D3923_05995 [Candidatus Electrothrix sp. AR3]|nr:hypothetical protein [Candidatus Electrothrix sp. AR3]
MKTKLVLFSAVGIFLLANIVNAAPKPSLKYTVNYAAGNEGAGSGAPETVISITNQRAPHSKVDRSIEIQVDFLDSEGEPVCTAIGEVPPRGTREFATTDTVAPFALVEFPADGMSDADIVPCGPFEGRAQISASNANIQIAAWLVIDGMPTDIPVTKKRTPTKGN